MAHILNFLLAICVVCVATSYTQTQYTLRPVAKGLVVPWEIEFGPDGMLWCTERPGIVSRIDVETGVKQVVLDIRSTVYASLEAGLLGIAIDPLFADSPYVYIASVRGTQSNFYRVVERYTFDGGQLYNPIEIFRHDPAANFHQGCRLLITPDRKLLITNGDAPYGTYDITADSVSNGKILRVNLDGSIPDDNPISGLRMWSKGHRNVQGITLTPNGKMWASEHGNAVDDEVNLIEPNVDYGWPHIEGYCDQPYEKPLCDSLNLREPVWASGNPTIAPAGLAYYNHPRFPEFKNSLLMVTLKASTLYRFSLNDSENSITEVRQLFTHAVGRLRDIAIHPDGRIFVCTSNREPNGYNPFPLDDDDMVYEVLAVPDTAVPVPVFPDSIHVRAWINDELPFFVPFKNTGDGPMNIENVYTIKEGSPLANQHWRVPITVLPNGSYRTDALFAPVAPGRFENEVWFDITGRGVVRVRLIGSTDVVVLAPDSTELNTGCFLDDSVEVSVPFRNVGEFDVNVSGASLTGEDAELFRLVSVPTGTVAPGNKLDFIIQYNPKLTGIHKCTLHVESDSYKPSFTVVTGIALPSGIDSDDHQQSHTITSLPNPFTNNVTFYLPPSSSRSQLVIADAAGRQVWSMDCTGSSSVEWHGVLNTGATAPAGMYTVTYVDTRGAYSLTIVKYGQ